MATLTAKQKSAETKLIAAGVLLEGQAQTMDANFLESLEGLDAHMDAETKKGKQRKEEQASKNKAEK